MSAGTLGQNPRYAAYCEATGGGTPDETLARDEVLYPGGVMCGFILWNTERLRTWRAANGLGPDQPLAPEQHEAYDHWLALHAQLVAWEIREARTYGEPITFEQATAKVDAGLRSAERVR